jgi:CheY-like chemotaxis protein
VLVVDDDVRNLLAIGEVLGDLADIVTAESGEEALRLLLKGGEYAVILLDVYMPGMDGTRPPDRRGREQTKRIPIVFLSAVNKETEHSMRGYAMGAVDYVFKPVEAVVLRSKVSVFVDLYEKTRRSSARRRPSRPCSTPICAPTRNAARGKGAAARPAAPGGDHRVGADRAVSGAGRAPAALPVLYQRQFRRDHRLQLRFHRAEPDRVGERLHPEDRDRVLSALAARDESGRHSVEYRWQCAGRQLQAFHDQAVLIRDPGRAPLPFRRHLLDVTDRKELESQLLHSRKWTRSAS